MSPNRIRSADVSTVEIDARVSRIVVGTENPREIYVSTYDSHGRTKDYRLIITPKRLLQLS